MRTPVLGMSSSLIPRTQPARTVHSIMRAFQTGCEVGLESGLALERERQQQLFSSDDAREGMAAFREARSPVFTGR